MEQYEKYSLDAVEYSGAVTRIERDVSNGIINRAKFSRGSTGASTTSVDVFTELASKTETLANRSKTPVLSSTGITLIAKAKAQY